MAYLDFASPETLIGSFVPPSIKPAPARLTGSERAAVMLAKTDGAGSLKPLLGRRMALVAKVLGHRETNRLADLRLETLRRFSVAVKCRKQGVIDWTREELLTLKFTDTQINEAHAIASRFPQPRSYMDWFSVAIGLLLLAGIYYWVTDYLGDPMISLVVVLAGGLPLIASMSLGSRT